MTIARLKQAFAKADRVDREEGMIAYMRYHNVMQALADKYGNTLYRTIAVFVSLSPNSTYQHNLRGAASVLKAVQDGVPCRDVVVATYNHCRDRAYSYATGERDFFAKPRGPKIINFFNNIMDPNDNRWVTIDGHMSALWQGQAMTMREALITPVQYRQIVGDVKAFAFSEFMLPQQMQAILWFVRKRTLNVGFNPQTNILHLGDQWRTEVNADSIEPYPFRRFLESEHLGTGHARAPDLRGPIIANLRNRGRGRLPMGVPVGVEQEVFSWGKEVLPSTDADGCDG